MKQMKKDWRERGMCHSWIDKSYHEALSRLAEESGTTIEYEHRKKLQLAFAVSHIPILMGIPKEVKA